MDQARHERDTRETRALRLGEALLRVAELPQKQSRQLQQLHEGQEQTKHFLDGLERRSAWHAEAQQQMQQALRQVDTQLRRVVQQQQAMQQLSTQVQRLSDEHYDQHIIGPIARTVIEVLDTIERSRSTGGDGSVAEAVLGGVEVQLRELLEHLEIEPIRPQAPCPFDPKTMRPHSHETTASADRHGLVARVDRAGYRRRGRRLLRPASVALFQYQPNGQPDDRSITTTPQQRS